MAWLAQNTQTGLDYMLHLHTLTTKGPDVIGREASCQGLGWSVTQQMKRSCKLSSFLGGRPSRRDDRRDDEICRKN